MKFGLSFVLLLVAIAAVSATAENDVPEVSQLERNLMGKLSAACATHKPYACTKLKLLMYTDKIWQKSTIHITDDVVLTRNEDVSAVPAFMSYSPRDLDSEDEDSSLLALIWGKARSFLQSRELHWKVLPETEFVVGAGRDSGKLNFKLAVDTSRAMESGRKLKKWYFAGTALMFVNVVSLVMKALMVSKAAFVVALLVALSRALYRPPTVTYEVVSHPHVSHTSSVVSSPGDYHSSSHSIGHDSYASSYGHSRSGVTADHLAYSAHVPK
ncbi:hypothetical protein B566_EDAN009216 [Ephemera danica]|nr:hypothetical protein B566_EDAN009216 [Ephemera danica]